MATWTIRLFGSGGLSRSDLGEVDMPDIWWPVIGCLLATPGHRASRGRLAGQLWPDKDESSARHCLASALWRIKARLPRGNLPLAVADDRISLNLGPRVWVDVIVFERRASDALAHPQTLSKPHYRRRLAHALAHYRSDFLAERDEEAITLERERLRALYLDAQYELAIAQAAAHEWSAARSAASMICLAEPLREDAQRLLMISTAKCGNRALALRLYRSLERLLVRELNVAPMPETMAVMRDIAGGISVASSPTPAAETVSTCASEQPLVDYRGTLVRTRDRLALTLHELDHALAE